MKGTQADLDDLFRIPQSELARELERLAGKLVDNFAPREYSPPALHDIKAKLIQLRQCVDFVLREYLDTDPATVPQSLDDYDGEIDPLRVAKLRRDEEPTLMDSFKDGETWERN